MTSPLWIEIVNWDKFQHYKERRPVWIKVHLDLLQNDDYLGLTEGARLLLIELWMLRGIKGSHIALTTASLTRQRGVRTTRAQVKQLADAGFIRILASKPLAKSLPRGRDIKDLETNLKINSGKALKRMPNG